MNHFDSCECEDCVTERRDSFIWHLVIAMSVVLLAFFLSGCTNEAGAMRALKAQGFKDVKLNGYAFVGCGQSDDTATAFEATSPIGERVEGVVCCGFEFDLFAKGCTVRF